MLKLSIIKSLFYGILTNTVLLLLQLFFFAHRSCITMCCHAWHSGYPQLTENRYHDISISVVSTEIYRMFADLNENRA